MKPILCAWCGSAGPFSMMDEYCDACHEKRDREWAKLKGGQKMKCPVMKGECCGADCAWWHYDKCVMYHIGTIAKLVDYGTTAIDEHLGELTRRR